MEMARFDGHKIESGRGEKRRAPGTIQVGKMLMYEGTKIAVRELSADIWEGQEGTTLGRERATQCIEELFDILGVLETTESEYEVK